MVAVWDRNGIKQNSLLEIMRLNPLEKHRIAVVGGGGKTTLIQALAEEFAKYVPQVIVTPTTKIFPPDYGELLTEESIEKLRSMNGIITVGLPWKYGKLTGVSKPFLEQIFEEFPIVLMEADGAKGYPSKAPREGEPVIVEETTLVIAVQGIDACEKPLEEGCFRIEQVCEILGKSKCELLSPEDMAKLYLSEKGFRKNVENRPYWTVIQKVETAKQRNNAQKIIDCLEEQNFIQVLITKRN